MSLRAVIARSIRPIVVSALGLGAAMLMASPLASAAEPVKTQPAYSSWGGSGPIAVTLIHPVGPVRGFEPVASRLKQVEPAGFMPVNATMPTALPVPLEHIIPST